MGNYLEDASPAGKPKTRLGFLGRVKHFASFRSRVLRILPCLLACAASLTARQYFALDLVSRTPLALQRELHP